LTNEKHEFSGGWRAAKRAGRQAALQDGPVGCTLRRAGGCTLNWVAEKGGPKDFHFLQAGPSLSASSRTVLLSSPPFCLLCSPPKIYVFHLETRPSSPPGPPALQFVLSRAVNAVNTPLTHRCQTCGRDFHGRIGLISHALIGLIVAVVIFEYEPTNNIVQYL